MLYKYRELNNFGMRLISNGELYFSPPDHLNDPLDCQFYPHAVLKAAVERITEKSQRDLLKEILHRLVDDKITGDTDRLLNAVENRVNKSGILSFSLTAKEPLMWSHYAGGHAGICVGIDKTWMEHFIDREEQSSQLIGGQKVSYKDKPDFHEILITYIKRASNGKSVNTDHMFVDIVMPVLRTKSKHWVYEDEYRIIRRTPGVIHVPKKAIREVIVGRKISEGDLLLVRSLLADPALRDVRLGHAEFGENSFLMDIKYE